MDSEEENSETKSPISSFLSDGQSEESLEPCHPSPDLTFPPGQSAASAKVKRRVGLSSNTSPGIARPNSLICHLQEAADPGIRLRSYSYSSAKIGAHSARVAQEIRTSDSSAGQ